MSVPGPLFSSPFLEFTPSSEQEVVFLFGLLLPYLPRRFLINEVREAFPDCIAFEISTDGQRTKVRIEFELVASNFLVHGHNPVQCDLIVCWEDNLPNFQVPRLALGPIARKFENLFENDRPQYEKRLWTEDSFFGVVSPELIGVHRDLLSWASPRGCVRFGQGAKEATWVMWLNHPATGEFPVFGVYANGKGWITDCSNKLPPEVEKNHREYLAAASSFGAETFTKRWFNIDLTIPANVTTLTNAVDSLIRILDSTTQL